MKCQALFWEKIRKSIHLSPAKHTFRMQRNSLGLDKAFFFLQSEKILIQYISYFCTKPGCGYLLEVP